MIKRALLRYHYKWKEIEDMDDEAIFKLWCEFTFCKKHYKEIKDSNVPSGE